MLSKIWKLIAIFILIVACLFNLIIKLVNTVSLKNQVESTVSAPVQNEV